MQQTAQQLADYFLRRKEVERIAGISRASIYRLIKAGKFPAPVSLGTGAVRWKQSDVIAWQSSLTKKAGV
jgi:prophage regulatory protein